MDRFSPPTAADDLATCVCCGERFHYEKLSDVGECPYCRDEDEEEDMSEQETEAAELIAQSAVRLCEKLQKENANLTADNAVLREALKRVAEWYEGKHEYAVDHLENIESEVKGALDLAGELNRLKLLWKFKD